MYLSSLSSFFGEKGVESTLYDVVNRSM